MQDSLKRNGVTQVTWIHPGGNNAPFCLSENWESHLGEMGSPGRLARVTWIRPGWKNRVLCSNIYEVLARAEWGRLGDPDLPGRGSIFLENMSQFPTILTSHNSYHIDAFLGTNFDLLNDKYSTLEPH
jgi:hypothetical protein